MMHELRCGIQAQSPAFPSFFTLFHNGGGGCTTNRIGQHGSNWNVHKAVAIDKVAESKHKINKEWTRAHTRKATKSANTTLSHTQKNKTQPTDRRRTDNRICMKQRHPRDNRVPTRRITESTHHIA
jgi:hypothetical protein